MNSCISVEPGIPGGNKPTNIPREDAPGTVFQGQGWRLGGRRGWDIWGPACVFPGTILSKNLK